MFQVSLENFGVMGPGSHLRGQGSRVHFDHIGVQVLGPTYGAPGPGSHEKVSGPTFPVSLLQVH